MDHVNPEAPWPEVARLEAICAAHGRPLVERLTAYPRFVRREADGWIHPKLRPAVLKLADSEGLARDCSWSPGVAEPALGSPSAVLGRIHDGPTAPGLHRILDRAARGHELSEAEIVALFATRGAAARAIVETADGLRREAIGEPVTFVINRNINYTNICTHTCSFCAFSKSSAKNGFRDKPYNLDMAEIAGRAREAVGKGATEVCLQGGIHPSYTGDTYADILRSVKAACPDLHVHAFSPLEVSQGARTLGLSLENYLRRLKDLGLGSLPGTAAEILDDEIRAQICPDKVNTAEWLEVVGTAHRLGIPTTSKAWSTGRGTCWRSGACSRTPVDSPNSCRCRSCIWRRRCTGAGSRARVRPGARRC
jgi:FO synthase